MSDSGQISDLLSDNKASVGGKRTLNWKLIIIISVIALIIMVSGAYAWFKYGGVDNSASDSGEKTEVSTVGNPSTDNSTKITQTAKIYYTSDKNLYSINPVNTGGDPVLVDSGITSSGGGVGTGSNVPLMSFDQLKAVYIKDGAVWLKQDGQASEKLYQSTSNDTACYNGLYSIGWSSDSKNLIYNVALSEGGMGGPTCTQSEHDTNSAGFYWYSLESKKSTKLPITRSDMWVPSSNKIAYFEAEDKNAKNYTYQLKTYDVITKEINTLSKTGWLGYSPQLDFSDDGSKIIYVAGETNANNYSKIVIANADNSNQQELKRGNWAEYQFPKFLKNSKTNYIYTHSEGTACPSGGTGCPAGILYSVIDGNRSKVMGTIFGQYHIDSEGRILALAGYNYSADKKRTISLIDPASNSISNLFVGDETLNFSIGQ